jgi:hypothetical protein
VRTFSIETALYDSCTALPVWPKKNIALFNMSDFQPFADLPRILDGAVEMSAPNEVIPIFDGVFNLLSDEINLEVSGKIFFTWVPYMGVKYEGIATTDLYLHQIAAFRNTRKFDLKLTDQIIAKVHLNNFKISNFDEPIKVSGLTSGATLIGDKSVPVEKVIFSIPNMRSFHGEPVAKGTSATKGRLRFDLDDFAITVDQDLNYNEKHGKLENQGGFMLLWNGEIVKKVGCIRHAELSSLLSALTKFFSFLNGRRCSPCFLQGKYAGSVIWTDYTGFRTDQYKDVISWPPEHSLEGIADLWRRFYEHWKIENDRDVLNTIVHWYVEANNNSGFAEGAIVMIQTALELIYNWHLIEGKGLLTGRDAESITASNKIRLLLADLKIPKDLPLFCKALKDIGADDAPEAFVRIRNSIVHSQEEKRKKLSEIPDNAIVEAMHLGIWYIEIMTLKILGYKGKYQSRVSGTLTLD